MLLDSLVEHATSLTGVAEVLVATQIELFELTKNGALRLFVDGKVLAFGEIDEDFGQLVGRIVIKMNGLCKAALQSRVGIDEVVHLVGITGNNTNELTTIILQAFQQRIDSLSAKRILIT